MLERKIQNQTIRKVKDKMTKKDYIKFAAMLKERKEIIKEEAGHDKDIMDENISDAHLLEIRITADMVAGIFSDDNPRFNRSRFLTACGYTD